MKIIVINAIRALRKNIIDIAIPNGKALNLANFNNDLAIGIPIILMANNIARNKNTNACHQPKNIN